MIEVNENIKTHEIDKPCVPLDVFKNYYLTHSYRENMFKSDGFINPNYNSSKKQEMFSLYNISYKSRYFFILYVKLKIKSWRVIL